MYTKSNVEIRDELILPQKVLFSKDVDNTKCLLLERKPIVSFRLDKNTIFNCKNAFIILDFGKELHGGIRIITRDTCGSANIRITFGESLSECMTPLRKNNATNDHSPRDFKAILPFMSDLTFGQTGFRFVKLELLDNKPLLIQNVFALSKTQKFKHECKIKTNDVLINKIIETAIYTLKLNFQNGVIWDGIKRDRLIWCGDLNQEIITSLYCFGNSENITNSLTFLKEDTQQGKWINGIPSYSAWWVINLLDYYRFTGDVTYFNNNKGFAVEILKMINDAIDDKGKMNFEKDISMSFYLDWPTYKTKDAIVGTACIFIIASKKYLEIENNDFAKSIICKLQCYLYEHSKFKQVKAFQLLAGKKCEKDDLFFLENNGAKGFSTFMAYYLLTAMSEINTKNSLDIIKEYYGGMLSKGATTFWEDFDIDWLNNSNSIDRLPKGNEKDIHGDFGRYCYKKFRHSLCHGWSSGVVAYFVENIIGLKVYNGFRQVTITPYTMGLKEISAEIPTPYGLLEIHISKGKLEYKAPKEIIVRVEM